MVAFTDESVNDLRKLVEADFGALPENDKAQHDAFYAWLHYRARLIPSRPRKVIFSDEARKLAIEFRAIGEIAAVLRMGGDVSPWLSERVRRRKTDPRADLMFNDWQISHFHLGNFFERADKIKRSKMLLFAHIRADRAVLLDVQPHGAWSMQNLLRVLLRTSPQDMDTELRGILPGPPQSDDEIYQLRRAGLAVPLNIDGRVFLPPGFAVSSAGTAMRITKAGDYLLHMLEEVRRLLETNTLRSDQLAKIFASIGVPISLGLAFEQGVFIAYERHRKIALMQTRPLE